MQPENDGWLTRSEAAGLLRCSAETVSRYVRRGLLEARRLPSSMTGRSRQNSKLLVSKDSVLRCLTGGSAKCGE